MKPKPKLKPCYWCGGPAKMTGGGSSFLVKCSIPDINCPRPVRPSQTLHTTEEAAAAYWNTRAPIRRKP